MPTQTRRRPDSAALCVSLTRRPPESFFRTLARPRARASSEISRRAGGSGAARVPNFVFNSSNSEGRASNLTFTPRAENPSDRARRLFALLRGVSAATMAHEISATRILSFAPELTTRMTPPTRSAIVVAHPGHEVRLHGWLERERPLVLVLTDGSGREGRSRIGSTTSYLEKFGARQGCVFGRFTDLEVYRAVLARDSSVFTSLCDELADAFVAEGVGAVVGDASEGYNSTHDICRLVVNAAVELASRALGRAVSNYDFPVVARPDHCPAPLRARAVWLRLDDETFARKLSAAREFYPELFAEVETAARGRGANTLSDFLEQNDRRESATALEGLEVFRVECLRPVVRGESSDARTPFYETHGERQVRARHYERVIRLGEHMRPLAEAPCEHVGRSR